MEFTADFLEYRAARYRNREVFLGNHADLFKVIDPLAANFDFLTNMIGSKMGSDGASHIGLIPFLRLAQRQLQSAFDAVTSFQVYEAWLLLRPAVESALIIGKWLDDPALAQVWLRRFEDKRSYQQEYQGERLRSKSLPRSEDIQLVLKRINDSFSHPNPNYVRRHSSIAPHEASNVILSFQYFDQAPQVEVGCLAMQHLSFTLHESLRKALMIKFEELEKFDVGVKLFLTEFGSRIQTLQRESAENNETLVTFGLCPSLVA